MSNMEAPHLGTWAAYQPLEELLSQLGSLLSELCAAPASSDSQCRAVTVLLDSSASRFWKAYHALKKRRTEDQLNVAVLALTKSGKSTLLNALVGAELLPMNNVPETARICKVVHTVGGQPYLVEPIAESHSTSGSTQQPATTVTARGEAAVRARLHSLNQAVRDRSSSSAAIRSRVLTSSLSGGPHPSTTNSLVSSSSLPCAVDGPPRRGSSSGLGNEEDEEEDNCPSLSACSQASALLTPAAATGLSMDKMLSIHAPVAALLEYAAPGAEGLPGNVRLQLLDTPGPNEAGEEDLKHQVERLLDGVDVALYLLDYTKLKTQDEAGMFERLRVVNPALVRRLSQRLFFVVNKVDAAQVSEGQDLDATRQYVAELVTRQMGLEGFQLQPEQVLLLSARNALLSRLVLRGTATPEARARFVQLAFGRFANPTTIPQAQMTAAAHALLADSGLLDLEAQVLAYLYTHAAAVKHLAVVDDLGRLLAEVRNVTTSCAAALTASADALALRVVDVRAQLTATLAQFEAVQKDADTIGEEVSREVHSHLHTLRGRLFSSIINALDTSNAPATPASATARRWTGVRERFLSIFTGRGSGGIFSSQPSNITTAAAAATGSSAGGDGLAYYSSDGLCMMGGGGGRVCDTAAVMNAAGGAVARSRSEGELKALLRALHEDLTAQIHAEVREFWGVMEAVAAARHSELLATLNTHLADLSKQVESAVSRSLDVRLSPVSLSLAPPDASQFHADLDQLLARGVVMTSERHIRVNQKQVTEQVLRRGGGVCRWGDYWESVPRTQTVVEAYTLSVYEVVPSEITAHFISMVDAAVDATQASLKVYVSQFVGQQLQEARQQLQEYSDSYLGVMTGALDATHRGTEHRLAALAQVQALMARLDTLAAGYATLKSVTEGDVPRAQEPLAYDDLGDLCDSDMEQQDTLPPVDDKLPEEEEEDTDPPAQDTQEEDPAALQGTVLQPGVQEAGAAALAALGGEVAVTPEPEGGVYETSRVEEEEEGVRAREQVPEGEQAEGQGWPQPEGLGPPGGSSGALVPGSPMSVGSSVANAVLRSLVVTGVPAAPPMTPSLALALGLVPADMMPSGTLPTTPPATAAAHTDPATDAGKKEGEAGSGEAQGGQEVVGTPVAAGSAAMLDHHLASPEHHPFDYAKAMSCHLVEGGGVAGERGSEAGSEDWDLVEADEEKEPVPA